MQQDVLNTTVKDDSMFSFRYKSSNKTEKFLESIKHLQIMSILQQYGEIGKTVLSAATPKDTGKTAAAWSYEIEQDANGYTIYWTNDNINENVNIAIILQYGHGTGTGGYVAGRDYINPAIVPVFDQIADAAWKEVTNA